MSFFVMCSSIYIIIVSSLLISCAKDEDNDKKPSTPITVVDLKEAFLTDFTFSEVNYTSIEITQPKIVNNLETQYGKIKIKIPQDFASQGLSLKEVIFDKTVFSISPLVGMKKIFSTTDPIVYTISAIQDPNKSIHYEVILELDSPQTFEEPEITSFMFEKSKNQVLAQDIVATKIDKQRQQIFIFVPLETNFTQLTPTIHFKGEKLYYIADGSGKNEYPIAGKEIDFKYPKTFYLQVESASGKKIQFYNVIVDVKNPLKFELNTIDIPNVKQNVDYFEKILHYTNQGNHPITAFANSYKNKIPDLASNNIGQISLNVPGGGLLSGASGDVKFSLNKSVALAVPLGTYQFTVVVPPGFSNILSWPPDAAQLLESSELVVKVNLIK